MARVCAAVLAGAVLGVLVDAIVAYVVSEHFDARLLEF